MSGCIMPLYPHLGTADLWTKDSFEPDKNEELFLPEKKNAQKPTNGLRVERLCKVYSWVLQP